jgi:hypothetical protein
MDIRKYLNSAKSSEDIYDKIASLGMDKNEKSIEVLKQFLLVRDSHTYDKFAIPHLACRALLWKGKKGVQTLLEAIPDSPGSIYPSSIVEVLWYASNKKHAPDIATSHIKLKPPLENEISQETEQEAKYAIREIVLRSKLNPDLFSNFVQFLYSNHWITAFQKDANVSKSFISMIFDVFVDSSILITKSLLEEFEALIKGKKSEEVYQRFLMKNPVFIDPLSSKVITKKKLGSEFITDFVVQRFDNEYLVVEIEKPQDSIFTQKGDLSSQFIHAFGQVIDFQEWISSNIAYAQKQLPGISSPHGILVIGLKQSLSEQQNKKLKKFVDNSNKIKVYTYDDLFSRAKNLYNNLIEKSV